MPYSTEELVAVFNLKRAKLVQDNLMCSCPFARANHIGGVDTKRSFGINIYDGQYHCFTCDERGTNIRNLAYSLNILLPAEMVMQSLHVEQERMLKPLDPDEVTYRSIDELEDFKNPEKVYEMLSYRGISRAALRRFQIGFNSATGALTFPVFDEKQRLVGWLERNNYWENRYCVCPPGTRRENLLFGLDREHIKDCYLVEGPTDQLKLTSWHIESVATCGNFVFKKQAKRLINACDSIILVRDQDEGGTVWRRKAVEYLKGRVPLYEINIDPQYKDVGNENLTKSTFLSYKKSLVK